MTDSIFDNSLFDKLPGPASVAKLEIAGNVSFEPVEKGVRITARNSNGELLWGFIGSEGMLRGVHCQVAVYNTLREHITLQLAKHQLPTPEFDDSIHAAKKSIKELKKTLDELQDEITVAKATDATRASARLVARLVADANRMIRLEKPEPVTTLGELSEIE